jgi:hypothetical protein
VSARLYDSKKNPSFYWYISRNGGRYFSFLRGSGLSVSSPYFLNHVYPSGIPSKARDRSLSISFVSPFPRLFSLFTSFCLPPSFYVIAIAFVCLSPSAFVSEWLQSATDTCHCWFFPRYLRSSLSSYSLSTGRYKRTVSLYGQ